MAVAVAPVVIIPVAAQAAVPAAVTQAAAQAIPAVTRVAAQAIPVADIRARLLHLLPAALHPGHENNNPILNLKG